MLSEQMTEPRCTSCGSIVVRAGTSCASCDTDVHFEGAPRTAPSIDRQAMRGSHKLANYFTPPSLN